MFLNPSSAVLVLPLPGRLSVFPRKEIIYKVTLLFPLRRRYSVVAKKLKYSASSFVLHAMASVVSQVQIPRLALIVAAQDK